MNTLTNEETNKVLAFLCDEVNAHIHKAINSKVPTEQHSHAVKATYRMALAYTCGSHDAASIALAEKSIDAMAGGRYKSALEYFTECIDITNLKLSRNH